MNTGMTEPIERGSISEISLMASENSKKLGRIEVQIAVNEWLMLYARELSPRALADLQQVIE